MSTDDLTTISHTLQPDKRNRYPSSNAVGHDVDSSTELWDEDEAPHCTQCATSLHNEYTESLKFKICQQQETLAELKESFKALERTNIQKVELEHKVKAQGDVIINRETEIERLERTVEELDQIIESDRGLKALLRMKDNEIDLLNKELTKISVRVEDYNEIEAHNTDLQSELFARDRELMTLKHSVDRLKTTYLDVVRNNSTLEDKLVQQDAKHEKEKTKFENSVVKLTNKLIHERKRSEQLEQENAKSVRDCRLAVRLLQCASPSSNEHSMHHSNKLTFLFDGANNKPISNKDYKPPTTRTDLRIIKQNSFEEGRSATQSEPSGNSRGPTPEKLARSQSASCLESLHCISRQTKGQTNRQTDHYKNCSDCSKGETVSVLKDLLQGKKDAIHVLRVELGKRDKEIGLLRKKLAHNINQSINKKNMDPKEQIRNLETRVMYLSDENFNLKYQLDICRKMLDRISNSGL